MCGAGYYADGIVFVGKFKHLKVWERAKNLAVYMYSVTRNERIASDYGLKDQLRRAAVSIPSNIAEGDELRTNKQAVNYFYFAKGSAAEVMTQAIIAHEVGYITIDEYQHIEEECSAISAMLMRLIQSRKS